MCHRIIQLWGLEKTSKIMKSNHQPNTTKPIKICPKVPHLLVFWAPLGMVTPPPPWVVLVFCLFVFLEFYFLNRTNNYLFLQLVRSSSEKCHSEIFTQKKTPKLTLIYFFSTKQAAFFSFSLFLRAADIKNYDLYEYNSLRFALSLKENHRIL